MSARSRDERHMTGSLHPCGLSAEAGSLGCKICYSPHPTILPLVKLPLATGADIVNLHFASYRHELLTVPCSRDRFRPNDKIILFCNHCCPWTCLEVLCQFCICSPNCKNSFSNLLSCATCRKCANCFIALNAGSISFTSPDSTHMWDYCSRCLAMASPAAT